MPSNVNHIMAHFWRHFVDALPENDLAQRHCGEQSLTVQYLDGHAAVVQPTDTYNVATNTIIDQWNPTTAR